MNPLEAGLEALASGAMDAASVFARLGAAMFFLPLLGERAIPVRVRLVVALLLSACVAPAVADGLPPRPGPLFLLAETAVGLAFGFALRAVLMALQVAGAVAAQAVSLSQFLGAPSAEPAPAVGHVLMVAALALLAAAGAPMAMVEAAVRSYDVLPPGAPSPAAGLAQWTLAGVADAFALALRLAAPFAAVGLLYSLALGFLSRAMPQLMVALVGAPAIVLAGIALLAATGPTILAVWLRAMGQAL